MKKFIAMVSFFLLIAGVEILYWFCITNLIESPGDKGLFGDSFGALTSFFSGLAFAGMIYAIYLQSKELTLQRLELSLTREELAANRKEQAKAAEAQTELVKQQSETAKIYGIAAIVQGRYQYAAALGVNSDLRINEVLDAEKLLIELLEKVGNIKINLPSY